VVFCLGNGIFLASMLLMSLWLQTQMGYNASWAGLVSAPTGAVAVILTPLVIWAMTRMDARIIATIAFLASAASYVMRGSLTADASFGAIALPLIVQGIGSATFFVATVSIVLDGVPAPRIPSASGLSNFARIVASGFAVSIVTTLWDSREALHQSRLVESDTAYSPGFTGALATLQGAGLPDAAGGASIARAVTGQAYLLASIDIFWLSAVLCLAVILLVWLCRGTRPAAALPVAD
jgi:DHA2 family multidrug resistance protein